MSLLGEKKTGRENNRLKSVTPKVSLTTQPILDTTNIKTDTSVVNTPPPTMLVWIMLASLLCAIIILFGSIYSVSPLSNFIKNRRDEDEMIYLHIITAGTLLWPLLWYTVLGFSCLVKCPLLFIPFIWPILLAAFQIYDFYHEKCEDVNDHQVQRIALIGGLQLDTSTVISFSFATSSLFWSVGNRQNLLPSIRILVVALLICIGLIIPTNHFIDNNQQYTTYVRVFQRVCINFALGFVMTALIVLLTNCSEHLLHTNTS
jgi:hypothetical protein